MKKLKQVLIPWFAVLLLSVLPNNNNLQAHPWGGLILDNTGNIYFTFICPFVDDHHYACVWQINSEGQLMPALESSHSPSDIILGRSPNRMIYGAERNNAGSGWQARLWRILPSEKKLMIPPTTNSSEFHIQAYAVTDSGSVFFARDNQLYHRDTTGLIIPVELGNSITRIDDLAWGPENRLYILDKSSIKILREDASLSLLTDGLKKENPENLPFAGANIIFDFAVEEDGTVYLAYYGNRRVLKVSATGEITTLMHSEGPWSPHGVDIYNGDVYILESTIGVPRWWEVWKEDIIIPRVRKIHRDGRVSTVFEYDPN